MSYRSVKLVPGALEDDPTIPPRARRLWTTLVDLAREDATVELPVETVATVLDASVSAVGKWRRALVAAGWLGYVPGGGRGRVSSWTPLGRATRADVEVLAAECDQPVTDFVW